MTIPELIRTLQDIKDTTEPCFLSSDVVFVIQEDKLILNLFDSTSNMREEIELDIKIKVI